VRQEKGCIQYIPTVDIASGLPPQVSDANLVTMIETWESLEALRNHLKTPHMAAFFEKRKDMVEGGSSLKVLQKRSNLAANQILLRFPSFHNGMRIRPRA